MHDYIAERSMETASLIINKNLTVRAASIHMGVSKSTVHKDVVERLPKINSLLATEAIAVLARNKAERHIRGGSATKEKYLKAAMQLKKARR